MFYRLITSLLVFAVTSIAQNAQDSVTLDEGFQREIEKVKETSNEEALTNAFIIENKDKWLEETVRNLGYFTYDKVRVYDGSIKERPSGYCWKKGEYANGSVAYFSVEINSIIRGNEKALKIFMLIGVRDIAKWKQSRGIPIK